MDYTLISDILTSSQIEAALSLDSAADMLMNSKHLYNQRNSENNYLLKASIPRSCDIHETAQLRGTITMGHNVQVGRNVRLSGNIYILDNTVIRDDCFLRGNILLCRDVSLGRGAEIKSSLIGNHTSIGPLSFIGSSIIGSHVMLGALVRTSNVRLDNEKIVMRMSDTYIDCGNSFGCLIGDNVSIGLQSSIMPGRIIPKGSQLPPSTVFYSLRQVVKND